MEITGTNFTCSNGYFKRICYFNKQQRVVQISLLLNNINEENEIEEHHTFISLAKTLGGFHESKIN
jgi:hypothetical protein